MVEAKIKQYIDERGITQEKLSAKTGITRERLMRSLDGELRLNYREYEQICLALSVPQDKFIAARRQKSAEDK